MNYKVEVQLGFGESYEKTFKTLKGAYNYQKKFWKDGGPRHFCTVHEFIDSKGHKYWRELLPEFNKKQDKKPEQLQARVKELEREVEHLRRYGNKDCTAMADEALKNGEME